MRNWVVGVVRVVEVVLGLRPRLVEGPPEWVVELRKEHR